MGASKAIGIRGLSEKVYREAKAEAARLGIPLGRYCTDALHAHNENARQARQATGLPGECQAGMKAAGADV